MIGSCSFRIKIFAHVAVLTIFQHFFWHNRHVWGAVEAISSSIYFFCRYLSSLLYRCSVIRIFKHLTLSIVSAGDLFGRALPTSTSSTFSVSILFYAAPARVCRITAETPNRATFDVDQIRCIFRTSPLLVLPRINQCPHGKSA